MGQAGDLGEHEPVVEIRVRVAAARVRDVEEQLKAEMELRDRAIVEALDEGALTVRQAARAAGLSPSGVSHVLARAG